jgi:hypothetical protein
MLLLSRSLCLPGLLISPHFLLLLLLILILIQLGFPIPPYPLDDLHAGLMPMHACYIGRCHVVVIHHLRIRVRVAQQLGQHPRVPPLGRHMQRRPTHMVGLHDTDAWHAQ